MNTKHTLEYQILPYDYYVKDYFLAKSLLYVLRYLSDDILFHIALEEASRAFKISRVDIMKHIYEINALALKTE